NKSIEVYSLEQHNYSENTEEIENVNESDDLCYILFTSGTTGKPKGTMIAHSNLINYCLYCKEYMHKQGFKSYLSFSKFTFDMSIDEINFPLLRGSKIVLCNDEEFNNPMKIGKLIKKHDIGSLLIVPSRFENYMNNDEFYESINNIKLIVFGGEKLSAKLLENIYERFNLTVYNGYGPTETTASCTYKKILPDEIKGGNKELMISIGKPLRNCRMYILDKNMKPVPIGIEGEIFIGGYGVGKGYLNRPELTQEKFVVNPFINDEGNGRNVMYRTGDLGKWTEEGEIICLGRIDFQVKIRGQRIELSEIENTINEVNEIDSSLVIDKLSADSNNKYLVCYYIVKEGNEIEGREIRNYLKNKLPNYMIPGYFKRIYELPVTSNGKLDRKRLPEPDKEDLVKEEYIAPINEIEKSICKIYSKIFSIDEGEIGRMDDFLDLGGDSFIAINVSSIFEKEFKIKVNIKDIIRNSKVCELGKYIEDNSDHKIEMIKNRNVKEFPITSQQLGVYIDSIKNNNSILYNIPMSFRLNKNINIEKIKEGFNQLFNKHQILKSKYMKKEVNGETEIYGFIDEECKLIFENYDHENASSFVRPFDLSSAPLIRVGFIENEVLLIDMHHIISDGITARIIINELNKFYNEGSVNELEVQYGDYACFVNEKMKSGFYNDQIEFYKNMFNNDYETLKLSENENNKKDSYEENDNGIKNIKRNIDYLIFKRIDKFVKQNNISKTAFFLSIYGYILSKYSGQETIYSSIIGANRNNHYVENMIGMFVTTQPILLKFEENDKHSFVEVIKENMSTLMNMYNYQDLSLSEITKTLKLKKLNNNFIYQPRLDLSNSSSKSVSIVDDNYSDDEIFPLYEDNGSKFDISFNLVEKEDGYLISVNYNNDIISSQLMNKIIDSFIEMTRNVEKFEKMVCEINYIPTEEKEKIINKFNENRFEYPQDKLYHTEFSKLAQEIPNKCAIVCNGIEITYRELDEMSNSLAHYLRSKGIGRGNIVPIISERSQYFIIAALAVMKSGAGYLPVDPEFPYERIQYMMEE
ncbi:hypothetical protein PIROE2DRAFT_18999, partial [Piromyces sp. E2]